jgi:hypothetical protein
MAGKNWEKMIDKIRLTLTQTLPRTAGQDIAGRLKNYRRQDINTGTGTIGNMAVHQNLDGVTIRGSIAKYLHGENIRPLTRKSVQAAIEKLEEDTGLSLGEAVLCSVEVGTSVILKEKPAEFMRLFGEAARYTKTVHSRNGFIETVLYGTSTGAYAFCVYDKGRECRRRCFPGVTFCGWNTGYSGGRVYVRV